MSDSEYTGHVEPGGEPATRTLPNLAITKLSVGPMDNNAYLLVCRKTGDALLIDAANDIQRIADLLEFGPGRPRLRTIVTTHRHYDHWQALGAIAGQTGANLVAHKRRRRRAAGADGHLSGPGVEYAVGEAPIEFLHLRGHTPGSLAVLYRDPEGSPHLFTGDSLFPGGPGKDLECRRFRIADG